MRTFHRIWLALTMVAVVAMTLPFEALAQRRGGGSFGGSRGGGSGRSFSSPRRSPSGGGSFGGSRQQPYATPRRSTQQSPSSSTPGSFGSSRSATSPNTFGGSRLNSARDYTSRYGTPRRTERQMVPGATGTQPYVVHRYGGLGDGFMMGYMMGAIPWYYSMPFHPAFYYSRPYTVANTDGTTAVYPGTFEWGSLIFTLLVIGGIAYIAMVWLRNRRRRLPEAGADWSSSSFT